MLAIAAILLRSIRSNRHESINTVEGALSLTRREVRAKLMRPVGRSVKFKYPDENDNKEGDLKDRVIARIEWHGDGNQARAVYWDVIDLIEFPHRGKPGDEAGTVREFQRPLAAPS